MAVVPMTWVLPVILLAASHLAGAMDLGAWRDLSVHVDSVTEPISVNGVPLQVSRATGIDVERLADRLEQKWTRESGRHAVHTEMNGVWTIMSRIHDAGLEVAQWRNAAGEAELLWSHSELSGKRSAPVRESLRLPAGCVSGQAISGNIDGRFYLQRTARCSGSPKATLLAVQRGATRQNYQVQSRDGQVLARNGSTEITVLAMDAADGYPAGVTNLVYLEVHQQGPGR
ncbi:MAG: hypothetical protein ABI616_13015 [Pseudomonadota bacterium]